MYAAHANNGIAQIGFIISPDDAKLFQVLWFALGEVESRPSADSLPSGSKRFAVLSEHFVAAAFDIQHYHRRSYRLVSTGKPAVLAWRFVQCTESVASRG